MKRTLCVFFEIVILIIISFTCENKVKSESRGVYNRELDNGITVPGPTAETKFKDH